MTGFKNNMRFVTKKKHKVAEAKLNMFLFHILSIRFLKFKSNNILNKHNIN